MLICTINLLNVKKFCELYLHIIALSITIITDDCNLPLFIECPFIN